MNNNDTKKERIVLYLDKKTADSMHEAARMHDCGIKKVATTVLKIFADGYSNYPLFP